MNEETILSRILTSLRELSLADLKNGVHVQLAAAIENQIPAIALLQEEIRILKESLKTVDDAGLLAMVNKLEEEVILLRQAIDGVKDILRDLEEKDES